MIDIVNGLLQRTRVDVNILDRDGVNALILSIYLKNIDIFTKILQRTDDVNIRDNFGDSALIVAIYVNDINIFTKYCLN